MTKIAEIEVPEDQPAVPWGYVNYTQTLDNGVVYYALQNSDSLIGVTNGWANKNLTPWARSVANPWKNKYWFTWSRTACVFFYEHPELAPLLSGDDTDNNASKYEEYIRLSCPEYFNLGMREFLSAEKDIPAVKDLQDGDEIGVIRFGVPGNVQVYTFISTYGKKKQGLVLMGDEGGAYRITERKYKENVILVKRGTDVLFMRAAA